MKKWIMMVIMIMFLAMPLVTFAQCENPLGKTFQSSGITIYFAQGYQQDTIAQVYMAGADPVFFHYTWDGAICRATLENDPPIYLDFDEMWFEISDNPYKFAVVTSVD